MPGNLTSLLLRDLFLDLEEEESALCALAARTLGVPPGELRSFRILRRGIDARHKGRIRRVYTVAFDSERGRELLAAGLTDKLEAYSESLPPEPELFSAAHRVLVVGMGPAGLFAAWRLAQCGAEVVLVERGRPVEQRVRDVRRFWAEGELDPESNVQFGEGGAGTFSDGKLTTRINHPWTRLVLQTLVDCGAPEAILQEAKPHVGTDRLRLVLINFRHMLQRMGVELRYETRLTGLLAGSGRVRGAILDDAQELFCDSLVLAPGHSARDTYSMLQEMGVGLEGKGFAVGLRVEHPAELINRIQYGMPGHPQLPPADYRLAWNDPQSGRGVYSFCMCPGGEVVISSSEAGGMVVNGMSSRGRSGGFSNSALVVSVGPEDFPSGGPLAGMEFQRQLERRAFVAGGADYHAPAQNLLSFLRRGRGPVTGTCRPGVRAAELDDILPEAVSTGLRRALPVFERRMRGFVTREAVLIGVESRTSAPLRILRGEDGQSITHAGLYPAGEGAGYAGGIMSAALDGLRSAEHILAAQRVQESS